MIVKDGIISNTYTAPAIDLKPLEGKLDKALAEIAKAQEDVIKIIEQIEPLAVKVDEVRADVIKMQDDVTIIKTNTDIKGE